MIALRGLGILRHADRKRIAEWIGDLIGVACLFIVLFGTLILGTAIQ